MAASSPTSLNIRTYHVGFGDCFLLSFRYGSNTEKHVLIDFGSTGFPPGVPKTRMLDIAKDIEKRTNGKLSAVVATHRHKDHISGFETKSGGGGTGDIIRSLKPDLVIQPWTENPELAPTAESPDGPPAAVKRFGVGTGKRVGALTLMHTVAEQSIAASRHLPRSFAKELSFLGETNINNPSAVTNLMTMAKNNYVYCGQKSGLEKILPGVTVKVLGPPTVKQTATIKKERSKDPTEFWQFQAAAATAGNGGGKVLFPKFVHSKGSQFPLAARWLVYHARLTHADQKLQIVRMLDDAMNNTSVILMFQVGRKRLLFPGDAQIENWQYALSKKEYAPLLKDVDLYKVGHHGSRNATPKTLWGMFAKKSPQSTPTRLRSLMSTMEGKHGSVQLHTEVPRATLVHELEHQTELFSTQQLAGRTFFHDTPVTF